MAIQLSVTRVGTDHYKLVVQSAKSVLRSYEVESAKAMFHIDYELKNLELVNAEANHNI